MRALVKTAPRRLELQELDRPQADGRQVIIKVSRVGICGSDLHMWEGTSHLGIIFGHELCGIVDDPGPRDDLKPGQRVLVYPMQGLGVRRPGGLADYLAIPPEAALALDDAIDDDSATLVEPACISLKAYQLAQVSVHDRVLVTGAGMIGLMAAMWLKLAGVRQITLVERNNQRQELARKLNAADQIFSSRQPDLEQQLLEISHGGFDKAIECTGHGEPLQLAVETAKRGAKIIYAGITYEPLCFRNRSLVVKELCLQGCFGSSLDHFAACLADLKAGRINLLPYITSRIPLEQAPEQFANLADGMAAEIKSLVIL